MNKGIAAIVGGISLSVGAGARVAYSTRANDSEVSTIGAGRLDGNRANGSARYGEYTKFGADNRAHSQSKLFSGKNAMAVLFGGALGAALLGMPPVARVPFQAAGVAAIGLAAGSVLASPAIGMMYTSKHGSTAGELADQLIATADKNEDGALQLARSEGDGDEFPRTKSDTFSYMIGGSYSITHRPRFEKAVDADGDRVITRDEITAALQPFDSNENDVFSATESSKAARALSLDYWANGKNYYNESSIPADIRRG